MRQRFIFVLMVSCISVLHADLPWVGNKAPKIEIVDWVSAKIPGTEPFAGKTVILEFWATWCVPCVEAIPHLNQLSEKFAGRKVVFVPITNEKRSTIEAFFKRHQMKSSVVIDKDRQTTLAYGVEGIPCTFLIDAKGILRWQGYPTDLTEQALSEFLKSAVAPKVPEPSKPATVSDNLLQAKIDPHNVFLLSISPTSPERYNACRMGLKRGPSPGGFPVSSSFGSQHDLECPPDPPSSSSCIRGN